MVGSPRLAAALLLALLAAPACSLRRLAVGGLAGALSGSAEAFQREDDPELVREALPFALEALEAVLLEEPENGTLLAASSAGLALYASAFLERDAEVLEASDYARATRLRERALALHLRARDRALRGLELRHPGICERLRTDPAGAAGELEAADLDFAYLAGGTWGLAIALG